MEADTAGVNQMPGIGSRLFPAVGPVLLISMGYIDPGKWSAVVEGGARFGFDLVLLLLVFNLAAILCQYLAARVGIVTGKNLAQICSEEYDKSTCVFLGIQAELSVFLLDLTMILGIAHGLNLLFGVNLFASLFVAATDALLFPLLDTLLEKCKAEILFVRAAGFVLLSYVLGVLISQPEIPLVLNGMLTSLSGESAFALMGLLGANIMPHNFYLHSFVVQQQKNLEPPNVSRSTLCHDHFFAILCIFSSIFLVNYAVMSSAAAVFHSAGVVVLTFQDVLLLMDQVFGSPMAPFAFFLILFISSHITGLTWNLGGQVVLRDLLSMDVPVWLHRATIRVLAIVLALFCTWSSGAEGLYQLLICTQVLTAMMLPSSVIPLFRVASSRSIMDVYKISQFLEFLALITLIGMLGLNIIFIVELLFGNSDWVGSLKWNMGSTIALPYVLLLITSSASLVFMLWLAATPLKSATLGPDAQVWKWDLQNPLQEPLEEVTEGDIHNLRYHEDPVAEEAAIEKSLESFSDTSVVEYDFDLPEAIINSDQEPHLPKIEDNSTTTRSPPTCELQESTPKVLLASVEIVDKQVSDAGLQDVDTLQKIESADPVGQTIGAVGDLQSVKDDGVDTWEPEQSSIEASGTGPLTSEGSGSFRSLSGKTDDGGNGSGSLSRLSGLGRAARRQLASILDEFWGQLYDHHGQATQEARAKKLDMLFGVDMNLAVSSLRVDSASSGYFPSVSERGPAYLINSSIYDSPKQQRMPLAVESPYGVQTGSSMSSRMQLLDDYVQSSSRSMFDSGEKRYSSLRLPPSSEGWNYQPATVHGYQMASYLSRMATDRNSDSLNTVLDPSTPKSPSSSSFGHTNYKEAHNNALGQIPQNRVSSVHASITQNPVMARGSRMQADRPYYSPSSSGPGDNVGSPAHTKKYHSLPDIKGLVRPQRDSNVVERISQLGGPPGFGPPVGRPAYEKPLHSNVGSRPGVPSVYGELSPPKLYRGPFSGDLSSIPDAKSLWSRQPSEQLFGMEGKIHMVGKEAMGRRPSLVAPDAAFHAELESKMLQSFRNCIVKLLKLEGSEWLFRPGGADEDLIDRVAARERFNYETEIKEINDVLHMNESLYMSSDRKFGSLKNEEAALAKFLGSPLPHCGEACIWRVDLIVSFGVWCIHRILELSLMESRPELWGKYTYVLNRLQGILDPAFSKPRIPQPPCICLQVPAAHAKRSSSPLQNGLLPPAAAKLGSRGKCTSASALLDIIKDVEIAVSCRKGRTGTVAGDVAFPKGKENLASVLKRYKRRLTSKAIGTTNDVGSGLVRKVPIPSAYAL